MIKFFRTIRQNLLTQGRVTRYATYAIGEIVLVVIGILIALQINTWNQDNQRAKLEKGILIEIDNNLKGDLIDVQDEIASFKTILRVDSVLIEHFRAKRPFNDSIAAYLHIVAISPHLSPGQNGYKLLESKGIDIISNDSLRMMISNLYERNYSYYMTYAAERFDMLRFQIHPYWTDQFFIEKYEKWPYSKRVAINYDELLDDPQLIARLQNSSYQASIMLSKSLHLNRQIETVREGIRDFLEDN
ncbi:DUF6090 family protein [Cryomorphaceae bacterium 1068]|nr:DUF6090 family protein [Cryomorphaceae bacterium 1068]